MMHYVLSVHKCTNDKTVWRIVYEGSKDSCTLFCMMFKISDFPCPYDWEVKESFLSLLDQAAVDNLQSVQRRFNESN